MGTRGAWGFRVDGVDKVAFNHYDSYPEGLGNDIVGDLSRWVSDHSVEDLRDVARRVVVVDMDDHPSQDERIRYHWAAKTLNKNENLDWNWLLRDIQGEIRWVLKGAVNHLPGDANFLKDSMFCEWAYIINVDDEVFEVYKGFNKDRYAAGRYAALADEGEKYAGVALIATYPFKPYIPLNLNDLIRNREDRKQKTKEREEN